MPQATLELGGLVDAIRTVVNDACKTSHDSTAKNSTPATSAKDVSAMRETILGNARVLWPILNPKRGRQVPDLDIIVFGSVGFVRANVVWRDGSNNIIFIKGSTGDSVASATESLLLVTMNVLEQKYIQKVYRDDASQWKAACMPNASGAGWYEE